MARRRGAQVSSVASQPSATGPAAEPTSRARYPVRLEVDYVETSSPLLAIASLVGVKLVLLVPHLLVVGFLLIASAFVAVAGWIIVIMTARHTSLLFEFQAAVLAWLTRIMAWYLGLTDQYPPFVLRE